MRRLQQRLILEQTDKKLKPYIALSKESIPPEGWIYTIRKALNLSLRQLAKRIGVSPQSIKALERNEKNSTISLKSLREVARALDLQLVYALLPNEGSLESMIEKRAKELATEIVARTSQSMKLENQENSAERISKSIDEKTEELKYEMPKFLWD